MPHYCDIAPSHPVHAAYHDTEYGFPSRDEGVIFERLVLEIMQAGLSWEIVLKKRQALAAAFDFYDIEKVAAYDSASVARLLADPRIIRNRRKIDAIIANARIFLALRATGGISAWLDRHAVAQGQNLAGWTKLFRATFRFMGSEIVKEFLMSLAYLEGAHRADCPVFQVIERLKGLLKK